MLFTHSIFQISNLHHNFWTSLKCKFKGQSSFVHTGYIKKYSKKEKQYVIRIFELQNHDFSYINNNGIIKTRNIQYDFFKVYIDINKNEYAFILSYAHQQKKFICSSLRDLNSWIQALQGLCLHSNFDENYKILDLIGNGSTANVYKIQSNRSKRLYACKIFEKKYISKNQKLQEAIMMEAKILKSLAHENIIRLNYIYEDETKVYFILELSKGSTMKEYFQQNIIFNEEQARIITKKLLNILEYLKQNRIIHGDIKPSNIILMPEKNDRFDVKLIDFGKANIIDFDNFHGKCGFITPSLHKNYTYDEKDDIFNLGIVLYRMLFGIKPLNSSNQQRIVQNNQSNFLEFNSEICKFTSPKLKEFITKMTNMDPRSRISCIEALKHPWIKQKILLENNILLCDDPNDHEDYLDLNIEQKIQDKYLVSLPVKLISYIDFCSLKLSFKQEDFPEYQNYDPKDNEYWN